MKTLISALFIIALVSGCTTQQARDTLEYLPYGVAKGACKGSSNCTFTDSDNGKAAPKETPRHWYEDGYGRDGRIQRPID